MKGTTSLVHGPLRLTPTDETLPGEPDVTSPDNSMPQHLPRPRFRRTTAPPPVVLVQCPRPDGVDTTEGQPTRRGTGPRVGGGREGTIPLRSPSILPLPLTVSLT